MGRLSLTKRLLGLISRPAFWLILIVLILITLPHYAEALEHPSFILAAISKLGLSRHAFERILYLAPIAWAGFIFGWRIALAVSIIALISMLPRAIYLSPYPRDALFETFAVFIIGNVVAVSFALLRKEREYRTEIEIARQNLQANLAIMQKNEKQMTTLYRISSTVSQSLELSEVLGSAIDSVIDSMRADIAWIFLLDNETGELVLRAHRGLSEEAVRGIDRLKVGEGFNGLVAQTGEPLYVEDASSDPRLTREVVSRQSIRSQLIVPLRYRGKVNGTLCVAMHSHRVFEQEEVELLTAVGNQIGVAVENARLYQQMQRDTEQLREMQRNLRFYVHQVTRAQEEERKRISHELHDETVQSLVTLSRGLDNIASARVEMPEEYRRELEQIWQQTNAIIREVRRLSQDLRPAALDRLGLLSALEWLADDVAKYSGISTKVKVKGTERRLPEDVELVLFRITQEALRNVWRHAQANQAEITVEFDESRTKISISDNGKGFEPPAKIDGLARDGRLGLAGMHERAELIGGSIKVASEKGKGTTITVEVPVS